MVPAPRILVATLVALAIAGAAAQASAQEPALVPPHLTSAITPSYPEGAEGDASVLLAVFVVVAFGYGLSLQLPILPPFLGRS